MTFNTLKDLIESINKDLGDFCSDFAYTRKKLANLSKAPNRYLLFKYADESRDWAINEGGGTEIQFHIYFRNNKVGYGLGFNTQYVPFANEKSPVDYMKPFSDAFLQLLKDNRENWNAQGFDWTEGDGENMLLNPQINQYTLFGKILNVNNSSISDDEYQTMLSNIKGVLFDIYKKVFEIKNEKESQEQEKIKAMEFVEKTARLLQSKHNIILQGAPGTGKTYNTAAIALKTLDITDVDLIDHKAVMIRYDELLGKQIFFTTFHQSLDYEDFVEGLKPHVQTDNKGNSIGVTYEPEDGIFKRACNKAVENAEDNKSVVLIIDEINRGNVSKIFGELITLLESDKRSQGNHPIKVILPYTKTEFGVPSNLYIIGTMNTTDRSTGTLDYALRRRFAFVTLQSDRSVIEKHYDKLGNANLRDMAVALFDDIKKFIESPKHLCGDMSIDDLMVGHSYFMAEDEEELKDKVEYEIIPLINEYINDGILNVKNEEKKTAFDSWLSLAPIQETDEDEQEEEEQ